MSVNQSIMKKFILLPALLIMSMLVLESCQKDEPDENLPDTPELPPENAFVQDMGDFGKSTSRSNEHYNFAALNVGIWNTLLYINLAIPVKAWYEVRESDPVWDKVAEAWVWSREFNLNSGNYTARLHGWIDGDQVQWRMYVSHQGVYSDFLWYRGTAKLDRTSGSWRLFRDHVNDQPYIDIEWENDPDSDFDNIKYINAIPNDAGAGSYIHYGRVEGEDYPIFYDIFGAQDDRLIEIDYDDATTAGRVRDDVFFGTEDWNCWDALHEDIECN